MPTVGTTTGLPTGATVGQVLYRTASGTSWAAASASTFGPGPLLVTNRWYDNRLSPWAPTLSRSVPISSAVYLPLWLPAAATIKTIGVYNTAATGTASAAFASYAMGSNGQPTTINWTVNRSLANANVGSKTSALSPTQVIPSGWSFLAVGALNNSLSALTIAAALQWAVPCLPNTSVTSGDYTVYYTGSVTTSLVTNPVVTAQTITDGSGVPVIWFQLV